MNQLRALRESWGMLRSDDRTETYLALSILVVVFGPVLYRMWRAGRQDVHTENRQLSRGSRPRSRVGR